MYSKSDKKQITINNKADEVIKKVFKQLLNRYQKNLETSMESSDFIFDYVNLMYCRYHRIIQIVVDHI